MQKQSNCSSNHVSESETVGLEQNDTENPITDNTEGSYCDVKIYKQLCPLLTIMKIFGLYYKRYIDKCGKPHTERCMYYCLLISTIMLFNVLRSFSVYRIGDSFNHGLVHKVLFTIWSMECALKGIILIKSCYRQDEFPYFFAKWRSVCNNAPLRRFSLLMMKKYIILTFVFLTANSVVFILVLLYVPVLNNIYLQVVWRDALDYGPSERTIFKAVLGFLAVLHSTSSLLPVSLFVVLSCAVGKQMNKFKQHMTSLMHDDDFDGKIEDLRLHHQNLSSLVDILDRIFAPMTAAVYGANIPMFCLVLYTMITSTNIHVSLVLINFFWLCFILLQMTIVSSTAAWVNSQAHSPLEHIYTIRFSSTSNDTQLQMYMFLNRLTGTQIGFTAMRLFVVDRPTILTIAGMMMTYFVILVQFKLPTIQFVLRILLQEKRDRQPSLGKDDHQLENRNKSTTLTDRSGKYIGAYDYVDNQKPTTIYQPPQSSIYESVDQSSAPVVIAPPPPGPPSGNICGTNTENDLVQTYEIPAPSTAQNIPADKTTNEKT